MIQYGMLNSSCTSVSFSDSNGTEMFSSSFLSLISNIGIGFIFRIDLSIFCTTAISFGVLIKLSTLQFLTLPILPVLPHLKAYVTN